MSNLIGNIYNMKVIDKQYGNHTIIKNGLGTNQDVIGGDIKIVFVKKLTTTIYNKVKKYIIETDYDKIVICELLEENDNEYDNVMNYFKEYYNTDSSHLLNINDIIKTK